VFAFDAEAGKVTFGDGTRGTRLPFGARAWADYDVSMGPAGNVGRDAISTGPELPAGMKVTNPLPTWGGAAAESVSDGEKQVARFLRHRDRLVTAEDFETIAMRTPGVAVGRVDVLTAYNPALGPSRAGDAAGAVTLMVIPAHDPVHPDAPMPDRAFLGAVCDYLEPRRLVTTELILRGPTYTPIWVTVGIEVAAGFGTSPVQDAVRAAVRRFLSPLPQDDGEGWPLNKPVLALELLAVANRVAGVRLATGVGLVGRSGAATDRVDLAGLELPQLVGLSVGLGPAPDVGLLRDGATSGTTGPTQLPVPVATGDC
jgi:predicted phage baseplate assembly protein